MPYRDDEDDEEDHDDDDDDDRDLPQAADMDDEEADGGDDDDADLAPCPYCGRGVYEGAEVCPYCRSFISAEDAPPRRRPVWLVVGVVVCIALVVLGWLLT